MERSKKKYVTSVHGLHHFNVDMKKAAKLFANKFGAGATVSKTPQGEDEILIQGDVGDDVSAATVSVFSWTFPRRNTEECERREVADSLP